MTSTRTVSSTDAKSHIKPMLFVSAAALALLAWVWFRPADADEARLAMLEADPVLVMPTLDGETVEQIGDESNVATRSWNGNWSITETSDRYALGSRRVNRYAQDLYDHMDASPWEVTSVRCTEDFVVISGRQILDGDWASLEFSAWATGPTGELSIRSAISATAGGDLVMAGDAGELVIDCADVR